MLSPGEYIVSAEATKNNIDLLNLINSSKKTIYRALGGTASKLPANIGHSGGQSVPQLELSGESRGAMTNFIDGVNNLLTPLMNFSEAVDRFGGFSTNLDRIIGSLMTVGQNIQTLTTPLNNFSTASTNLAAGLALFNTNASVLATAIESLSNLPSTITVQGTSQVNVVVTGAEAFKAINDQLAEQITRDIIATLSAKLTDDLKNGKLLPT
jgi:hypothetical protein